MVVCSSALNSAPNVNKDNVMITSGPLTVERCSVVPSQSSWLLHAQNKIYLQCLIKPFS